MLHMSAHVATDQATRLINRLCRHFQHKVPASWDHGSGRVEFDIGVCQLTATQDRLVMECRAPDAERLEQLGEVMGSHLVRFSAGNVGEVHWHTSDGSAP